MMSRFIALLTGSLVAFAAWADDLHITTYARDGTMDVTNTFPQGVLTMQKATALDGSWSPEKQAFSLGTALRMNLAVPETTAFFRALAVDLTPISSWLFSADDITDLPSFATELYSPSLELSLYLWNQLPTETTDLFFDYEWGEDPVLRQALVDGLNAVIQNGPLYDPQLFAGVTLSPATQNLVWQYLQGSALVRLNRMLLEDAYPLELARKQATGFTNLVNSFGVLTTVAGGGGTTDSPTDKWLPSFEGGPATNALLSRPHIAMADRAGNVYIADKEAHAIRKVTLDGNIHTVAGINVAGLGTTDAAPATTVALNNPNGLWVRADGTYYILDRDNGLIRKVDTNGICTLMVDNGSPILEGRGLWVSPDESILFYSAGTQLKQWDSTNGLTVLAAGFWQLGNLAIDPNGGLAVTDRKASVVYRIGPGGVKTVIAGTGGTSGGGEGFLATETGLWEVRGIWFLPTGGYFLCTDSGSQVWYVDTAGYIHLFLNGDWVSHSGDGAWFFDPARPKVSKVRQITMDYDGNLIITEHDAGYVRKVQFLRHAP